jgi:hypothetical protein
MKVHLLGFTLSDYRGVLVDGREGGKLAMYDVQSLPTNTVFALLVSFIVGAMSLTFASW